MNHSNVNGSPAWTVGEDVRSYDILIFDHAGKEVGGYISGVFSKPDLAAMQAHWETLDWFSHASIRDCGPYFVERNRISFELFRPIIKGAAAAREARLHWVTYIIWKEITRREERNVG